MKITLTKKLVRTITPLRLREWEINESEYDWKGEVTLDLRAMKKDKIESLCTLLKNFTDIRGTSGIIRDMETWIDILESKQPKMKKLTVFEIALKKYMLKVDGHRIFKKHHIDDDVWLCYRVTRIAFHEENNYSQNYHPAYVDMDLVYDKFGMRNEISFEFYIDDIANMTVPEILARKGLYPETKELREKYLKEVDRYKELIPQVGRQFTVDGVGLNDTIENEDDYNRRSVEKRGMSFPINGKVILDVFIEENNKRQISSDHYDLGGWFWENVSKDKETSFRKTESEEPEVVEVPVHTSIVVFDLQRHVRLSVHVGYLKEYVYDKKIADKLVLREEIKQLIEILIEHKDGGFRDIIENKSGGAIILLTGKAGIGKTLTAEVFAEATERPLYSVQASQLGTTTRDLEYTLKLVLSRASRWNAVTLIDEADVYIHERGNNIEQNAIVGVFLRTLEYFSSLLFMTTNRPDIVDDAIASRCIARIDYTHPTEIQQKKIWRILADQSKIELSDEVIERFVEKNNIFSGRDIKNILKLANLKSISEGKKLSVESIEYVAQFNPTIVERDNKDAKKNS